VDFNLLASNFGKPSLGDAVPGGALSADGGSLTQVSNLGTVVPEPTTLGLLGCIAGGLLARRRRGC